VNSLIQKAHFIELLFLRASHQITSGLSDLEMTSNVSLSELSSLLFLTFDRPFFYRDQRMIFLANFSSISGKFWFKKKLENGNAGRAALYDRSHVRVSHLFQDVFRNGMFNKGVYKHSS